MRRKNYTSENRSENRCENSVKTKTNVIYIESAAREKRKQIPETCREQPPVCHFRLDFHFGFRAPPCRRADGPEVAPESAPGWLLKMLLRPYGMCRPGRGAGRVASGRPQGSVSEVFSNKTRHEPSQEMPGGRLTGGEREQEGRRTGMKTGTGS